MAFPYPYPGPIPAYNNLPIEPQNYQPRRFEISAIVLGQTTIVTTTSDMDYVIGQQVRLLIPANFGSIQLSGVAGIVIAIPASNQVELDIDSSVNVAPFAFVSAPNPAQIIAIGDVNQGVISDTGRVISQTAVPGSFINIS